MKSFKEILFTRDSYDGGDAYSLEDILSAHEEYASQHIQGEGNCKCDNEIKTGQTSAMCCNICGLPDDENWKVPSPLPGTTVQGYSDEQLEAAIEFGARQIIKASINNSEKQQFIQSLNKK